LERGDFEMRWMICRHVISPQADFCHADDRIKEAIHRMQAHQARSLPVENRVVGILSIPNPSPRSRTDLDLESGLISLNAAN